VNWKPGDDVIIPTSVSDEQAKQKYPEGYKTLKRTFALSSNEVKLNSREGVSRDSSSSFICRAWRHVVFDRRRANEDGGGGYPQRDIGFTFLCGGAQTTDQTRFLTHLHADFVAGHLELRDQLGATIYLGAKANAEYKSRRSAMEAGGIRPRANEGNRNAGHTPESISIAVYDLAKSATEPHAVLTATAFCRRVVVVRICERRSDVRDRLGALLYDSLQNKILPLPDASLVYPAHGAGSLCGKAISKETVFHDGEQRRLN